MILILCGIAFSIILLLRKLFVGFPLLLFWIVEWGRLRQWWDYNGLVSIVGSALFLVVALVWFVSMERSAKP